MTSTTSRCTGNSIYYSDDKRFSSVNPRAVEVWESKQYPATLEWRDALFWSHMGNVPERKSCFDTHLNNAIKNSTSNYKRTIRTCT